MSNYEQRRNPAQIFLRRLGLLTLLCIVVAAIFGVWNVYQKERESATLRAQAESERADLLSREKKLNVDITKLQTDRGMEETLREQYALAGNGEGLIVIVDAPTPAPVHATSSPVMDWLHKAFSWW